MTDESPSPKLQQGDLVFMFRRRHKGLGVVLKYVDNMDECLGGSASGIFEEYKKFSTNQYRLRDEYRREVCSDSDDPDLAFDFFIYNVAFKGKLKTQFAYVRWFKRPSTFAADGIHSLTGWIPAAWLKSY
jgi:hypothetical protein